MLRTPWIGIAGIVVFLSLCCGAAQADGPPKRESGRMPQKRHKVVRRYEIGVGVDSYWLFEPADPKPDVAPVVVFNHGWFAVNPGVYGAWIDHMVRQGRIVIFPRYQNDLITKPADFLPNAMMAVQDAFQVLETSPIHVRPDRERFALMGHSAGGNLAAQMAAVAAESGLPKPSAVIAVLPGEVQPWREQPSFAKIPKSTLLVVAVAEDDILVGDLRGRQIFSEATSIPADRKKFILFRTDLHGSPKLIADHLAPTGYAPELDSGDGVLRGFQSNRAEIDALDHAGFWRIADITMEAAFRGKTLDEATARGELFRHLGYWSDGRKVTPPVVGDDLAEIPRVFPPNGIRLINWNPRTASAPKPDVFAR
jgi:acetyl esterase/lipase